jgi:predicted nucleic acid-binding Zn ribbon protein
VPDDRDRERLAREALARAKADALARGVRPVRSRDNDPQRAGAPDSPPSRRPGRRPRRDDPEPLHAAIDGLIDSRGWREPAAAGSVFGRWAQIVGPDLAAHTRPDSLADRELTVTADSTAWATQVRLLAAQLVRRLNAELGDGSVRRVKVRGPAAAAGPARRPGEWRVRGGRGPRDTYG